MTSANERPHFYDATHGVEVCVDKEGAWITLPSYICVSDPKMLREFAQALQKAANWLDEKGPRPDQLQQVQWFE